jgi:hypothetical protein
VAAQGQRLEHHDQRSQTHGELWEKIVKGDGKREVKAMN